MMMSGEKDFLDEFAEQDAAAEAVIEQPKESVEPAGSGPTRGPDGKFVRKEAAEKAEQAETGAKEAAGMQPITEPPSDDEEGSTVPLSVVKALRKELQELKRSSGQATQTQPKAPEFKGPQVAFEQDPRSYLEQTLHAQKMQMSMFMASQQNDEQTVKEAWTAFDEACRNDPAVSAYSYTLLQHPHPMGELVKWYKREQQLQMLNEAGSLEALIEQRLAAMGGVPQQPQAQAQARPNVPPSLAGTGKPRSSDGTGEPSDGFDVLFKR
jgi:hypothetical protein